VGNSLLREFARIAGLDPRTDDFGAGGGDPLPARLATSALAMGSVAAVALAVTATRPECAAPPLEPGRVAASFRADQLQRIDGQRVPGFAPGSGFFAARDGWVRTHANYLWHRAALLRALSLPDTASRDDIAAAVATRPAAEIEDSVYERGGIAVAVRSPDQWPAHPQAQANAGTPLLRIDSMPGSGPRATDRMRVLDLTRVIAGPVATRTLAWLGADVLRIDPPHRPEIEAQHLDTGPGKRTTLLDLRQSDDRATFDRLLGSADVVVTGYRPGSLHRYGLGPEELVARHPGLIVAGLSAWGDRGPWRHRRGFDSVVQAATGIAMIEGANGQPGALPAQALDHATGYLLAAAILVAHHRRRTEGGGALIRASLAGTATWLLSQPYTQKTAMAPDVTAFLTTRGRVYGPLPALTLSCAPPDYPYPARPLGRDRPAWI
jgi:crotonobetainyl-CoA:carnitine CoA-transferase CaiB-like acyl-CoA transferase